MEIEPTVIDVRTNSCRPNYDSINYYNERS